MESYELEPFTYTDHRDVEGYREIPYNAVPALCTFCGSRMERVYSETESDNWASEEWTFMGAYCLPCGWWWCARLGEKSWSRGHSVTQGMLKSLPPAGAEAQTALTELSGYAERLRGISPTDFERFTQSVLREFLDCEVMHVGRTHDNGIDLLIVHANEGIIPVQVKQRQNPKAAEGVGVIREFRGAMVLQGFRKGIFVTTANHYSREAIRAADAEPHHLVEQKIILVDSRRLVETIGLIRDRGSLMPMRHAVFGSTSGVGPSERTRTLIERKVHTFNNKLLKTRRGRLIGLTSSDLPSVR